MDNDVEFTPEQLAAYKKYERMREEGRYNMLDSRARQMTGLDEKMYRFVLLNYEALEEASND